MFGLLGRFVYGKRGVPGPGAESMARLFYQAAYRGPIGSATAYTRRWQRAQPPPVQMYQVVPFAGLGGIQAGQLYSSPLFDPAGPQAVSTASIFQG